MLRSEVELHGKFDYPVTLGILGYTERRIIRLQRVLIEAEIEIASVERPQRMIQPVVTADPELHALGFGDLEGLEYAHVPVEVCRSVTGLSRMSEFHVSLLYLYVYRR